MNYLPLSRLFLPAFFIASLVTQAAITQASDESLDAIISNHWDWVLEQYPEYRREYGDMSGNQSWTDLSADVLKERNADTQAFIADLSRIDPSSLSPTAQLNQRMLKTALQEEVESYENGLHLIALNMRSGPQHRYTMVERLPMATETDYIDWLARLEKLPEQLSQYQAL